jgi:hypothetical protein
MSGYRCGKATRLTTTTTVSFLRLPPANRIRAVKTTALEVVNFSSMRADFRETEFVAFSTTYPELAVVGICQPLVKISPRMDFGNFAKMTKSSAPSVFESFEISVCSSKTKQPDIEGTTSMVKDNFKSMFSSVA